eukprot:273081_1
MSRIHAIQSKISFEGCKKLIYIAHTLCKDTGFVFGCVADHLLWPYAEITFIYHSLKLIQFVEFCAQYGLLLGVAGLSQDFQELFHQLIKKDKKDKNNYWGGKLRLWLNGLMRLTDLRNIAAKESDGLFDWIEAMKSENKLGRYTLQYIESFSPHLLPNDKCKKIWIELESIKRNKSYNLVYHLLNNFI